ncbi:MAG: Hsp20/alpha crystallin family protein [Gammaproteobacteria bacterium]|nr:Hsp20/alpha crystallin family protein [Gammaproteobacteria bacterium]
MKKTDIAKSSSDEQQNYLSAFKDLEQKMEDMFQRLWQNPFNHDKVPDLFSSGSFSSMPNMDVIDRDKEIVVKAELPGFDKKDLDISITNRQLVIKAKTCQESKEEDGDYLKQEISKNEIYRSVLLPAEVDDSKVQTSFKNGVLELKIPKQKESHRKRIEVK